MVREPYIRRLFPFALRQHRFLHVSRDQESFDDWRGHSDVSGGSQAYGDGLWNNHLIGPFSSQGLPDTNHTLVPTLHDFHL